MSLIEDYAECCVVIRQQERARCTVRYLAEITPDGWTLARPINPHVERHELELHRRMILRVQRVLGSGDAEQLLQSYKRQRPPCP